MRQHQSAAVQFGASESTFDLGGLPITRLVIKKGAGKVDFDFSAPNPQLMGLLKLEVGAVGLKMFMSPIVPCPGAAYMEVNLGSSWKWTELAPQHASIVRTT